MALLFAGDTSRLNPRDRQYFALLPALPPVLQTRFDSQGDADTFAADDGQAFLPVAVGQLPAYYALGPHKCYCATGEVCSPTALEVAGGKSNNRKWRLSLRVLMPDGRKGRCLGQWLSEHKLEHLVPESSGSGGSPARTPRPSACAARSSDPFSSPESSPRPISPRGSPRSGGKRGPGALDPGLLSPSKLARRRSAQALESASFSATLEGGAAGAHASLLSPEDLNALNLGPLRGTPSPRSLGPEFSAANSPAGAAAAATAAAPVLPPAPLLPPEPVSPPKPVPPLEPPAPVLAAPTGALPVPNAALAAAVDAFTRRLPGMLRNIAASEAARAAPAAVPTVPPPPQSVPAVPQQAVPPPSGGPPLPQIEVVQLSGRPTQQTLVPVAGGSSDVAPRRGAGASSCPPRRKLAPPASPSTVTTGFIVISPTQHPIEWLHAQRLSSGKAPSLSELRAALPPSPPPHAPAAAPRPPPADSSLPMLGPAVPRSVSADLQNLCNIFDDPDSIHSLDALMAAFEDAPGGGGSGHRTDIPLPRPPLGAVSGAHAASSSPPGFSLGGGTTGTMDGGSGETLASDDTARSLPATMAALLGAGPADVARRAAAARAADDLQRAREAAAREAGDGSGASNAASMDTASERGCRGPAGSEDTHSDHPSDGERTCRGGGGRGGEGAGAPATAPSSPMLMAALSPEAAAAAEAAGEVWAPSRSRRGALPGLGPCGGPPSLDSAADVIALAALGAGAGAGAGGGAHGAPAPRAQPAVR